MMWLLVLVLLAGCMSRPGMTADEFDQQRERARCEAFGHHWGHVPFTTRYECQE